MIILPANTLSTGGYEVANSCRFNKGDSPYLTRTTETPTNVDKATFSFWVKKCENGYDPSFLSERADGNNLTNIFFNTSDHLEIYSYNSGNEYIFLRTVRKFRDLGAWMHIFYAFDTSQATNTNRVKLYINGVQETSFSSGSGNVYPAENQNLRFNESGQTLLISNLASAQYGNYYLAEVAFVDGVAHAVTDFGEFDEDSPTIWKPKDISSGITWGTNGFYFDFEDSGDLGDDESGNENDFAETNLAATDQCVDSPTNNWCVMNPLAYRLDSGVSQPTYSEGNCKVVLADDSGAAKSSMGTIGVSTGKWYWEMKLTTDNDAAYCGITRAEYDPNDNFAGRSIYYNSANGALSVGTGTGGTADTGYSTYTSGDIVGVAFDATNGVIWVSKNGTWQNSATIAEIGAGTTTNAATTGITMSQFWMPFLEGANCTWEVNFGNPTFSISSGNADGNGYGNFEYAVPSGYLALCTKNLGSDGG